MSEGKSILKGIRVLAVDDEEDILETIADILEEVDLDTARDRDTALKKIQAHRYDLAILDIMGVDGMGLLQETVKKGIPTVMLTAHAVNPEMLMDSIRLGAIAYLPKETLADLDTFLEKLLSAHQRGEPSWKLLFEELGEYFDERFGKDWKAKDRAFWSEFSRSYLIGKGIQQRLSHDRRLSDKGV